MAAILAVVLATGCGSGAGDGQAAPADDTTRLSSPAVTVSPTPTGPVLPESCNGVLTLAELDTVLGQPLVGRSEHIRGQPEPDIGRVERVNCRYGMRPVAGGQGTDIPIEVGLSIYSSPDEASQRVASTISQERSNGALPSAVRLGDMEATILTGPTATLLVLARKELTLALTVSATVAKADRAEAVSAALAGKVLEHLTSSSGEED